MAVPLLALRLTDRINSLPHQAAQTGKGPAAPPSPLAVADTLGMLGDLRGRLNTGRRVLRLFRFAENFHAAQKLYFSTSPGKPLELWLDISSRAFNGMYYLLETATLPDSLGVTHLPRVFSPEMAGVLAVEAQRFWLLALACGAASGALKVLGTYAGSAVPETGDGFAGGVVVGEGKQEDGDDKEKEKKREEEKAKARAAQRANVAKRRVCMRKMVADLLDIALPGSALGWVPLDTLGVSSAMLATTILTSLDFWEKCA